MVVPKEQIAMYSLGYRRANAKIHCNYETLQELRTLLSELPTDEARLQKVIQMLRVQ